METGGRRKMAAQNTVKNGRRERKMALIQDVSERYFYTSFVTCDCSYE